MRDALSAAAQPSTARRVLACAIAASLLCAGCAAVGPNYQTPPSALDAGFIGAGATVLNTQPVGADIATFWRGFNDPALDALVERALQANGDVRIVEYEAIAGKTCHSKSARFRTAPDSSGRGSDRGPPPRGHLDQLLREPRQGRGGMEIYRVWK